LLHSDLKKKRFFNEAVQRFAKRFFPAPKTGSALAELLSPSPLR